LNEPYEDKDNLEEDEAVDELMAEEMGLEVVDITGDEVVLAPIELVNFALDGEAGGVTGVDTLVDPGFTVENLADEGELGVGELRAEAKLEFKFEVV
jgi:hypothetical protein